MNKNGPQSSPSIFDIDIPPFPENVQDNLRTITAALFPLGEESITEGVKDIFRIVDGQLDEERCRYILITIKNLIYISEDKSPERIVPSILVRSDRQITKENADKIYSYLLGGFDEAQMHEGTSDDPIIIKSDSTLMGITSEQEILKKRFGKKDKDWKMIIRTTESKNDSRFDVFQIETSVGIKRTMVFDITSFYGKGTKSLLGLLTQQTKKSLKEETQDFVRAVNNANHLASKHQVEIYWFDPIVLILSICIFFFKEILEWPSADAQNAVNSKLVIFGFVLLFIFMCRGWLIKRWYFSRYYKK